MELSGSVKEAGVVLVQVTRLEPEKGKMMA